MAEINTKITIGMTNRSVTPTIDMVQGDNGRGLDIFITDDIITSESGFSDDSLTATMYAEKPSGKMVSIVANEVVNFNNTNSYEIRFNGSDEFANVIAEEGVTVCQVILRQKDSYITSFDIKLNVLRSLMKSRMITSSQEFYDLEDMIKAFTSSKAELDAYVSQFKAQSGFTCNVFYGTSEPSANLNANVGDIYIQYK